MKRLITLTMLSLALTAASYADVSVRDIVINQAAKTAEATNLRVVLDSPQTAQIDRVDLQVRQGAQSDWTTLKTWTGPITIKAGHKLALDYFPLAEGYLNSNLELQSFEVRAIVNSTGQELVTLPRLHQDNVSER